MSIITANRSYGVGDESRPLNPSIPGAIRRPWRINSFLSWVTTVDHKKIGIMYGVTAFMWFLIGGAEALLIRAQLARPNGQVLNANLYNEIFTMHGTTMVFMVVMPLSSAFFNYFTPLMVGARDVAFPRLNALSYWAFLAGGLLLYSSVFLGGAPSGGWFMYAPNSSVTYNPGNGIDFWIWGLLIMGVASTIGSLNLIVTILNMRAPGMTLFKMPVFIWMTLVTSLLTLFAVPVITVAFVLLMFDRTFGSHFFDPAFGGDPVLWQHLFWLFGHPEVYILVLPAMGIISEILPVFARKPLFGYKFIVLSGAAIGFLGWGVWAHHMFATGIGPLSVSAFSITTMTIAVPTGVKIFNWLATLWQGSIRLRVPMLYAISFIAMFTIGGLSGVTHSVAADDRQQTDTYYVVAHFHYVVFGGIMFGLVGGLYYWWPKIFGYVLNEKLGKIQFCLWFLGFNLTFAPMHLLGLQGMPRRYYTYPEGMGWEFWNTVATTGAFTLGIAALMFGYVVFRSRRQALAKANIVVDFPYFKVALLALLPTLVFAGLQLWQVAAFTFMVAGVIWLFLLFEGLGAPGLTADDDPWDGRTLEWTISSPPPVENFTHTPTVSHLDEFWHHKYAEDEEGRLVLLPESERVDYNVGPAEHIHLPSPSLNPFLLAFSMPVLGLGMIFARTTNVGFAVAGVGVLLILASIYSWILEPAVDPTPGLGDTEGGMAEELVLAHAAAATQPALSTGATAGALTTGSGDNDQSGDQQ